MDLTGQIDYFLAMLGGFRSAKTVRWYRDKLRRFAEVAGERWAVQTLEGLQREHIVQFFGYLRTERECAQETMRGYLLVLRELFRWLETTPEYRGITERLLEGLPALPRSRRVADALTAGEVGTLLASIPDERERAIVATFLGTGVRAGELAALQVQDVDLATNRLVIRRPGYGRQMGPKGGHERFVALPPVLKSVLASYIGRVRRRYAGESVPWLFVTRAGEPFSTEGLYRLVRRALERAGIRRQQMGPHLLRRTYASQLRALGLSKSDIAVRLGHSSTTGTRVVDESYVTREADQLALDHGPDPLAGSAALLLGRRQRQAGK